MPAKPGDEVVYRGTAHRALVGRRGRVVVRRAGVLRVHFYGLPAGEPALWDVPFSDVVEVPLANDAAVPAPPPERGPRDE